MINPEIQKCGAYPWQYCHKWHRVPKFQVQEPKEGQKKNQRNDHHESGEENWLQLYGVHMYSFVSVQFRLSVMSDSLWPHGLQQCQASLSILNYRSLLKLMSIESVIPSNHLIPFCPHLFPPSIFPSIRAFSNESAVHTRWPKYWSFSFTISPFTAYSGLISFRMDWLDLLVFEGIRKSLLQHHSSKASILWHSAFFIVQLSHPYMTTGKTIALTRQTFVGKVMSLLFDRLSMLIITFLPRSKFLLISWLQSPSAVNLEPKMLKSVTVSTVFPSICHEVMWPDAMILVFWMLSYKPNFSLSFHFHQEVLVKLPQPWGVSLIWLEAC